MGTRRAAGAAAVLRPVAGLLGLAPLLGLVVFSLSRFVGSRAGLRRSWAGVGQRSARVRWVKQALVQVVEQTRSLQPGLRTWLRPPVLALMNWIFDAACLAACLWALGVGMPWHGTLLAYGLTQIPGSLG
ncbi:hypothetical protein OG698_08855 [Streptomyces sp. NBC_01003]|uniref:hypothetical protein n=1 Tax=Streptomyces sp. NBC_01003 TaxID=2903714 RepID=UPI0038665574|nr:hypothetical protein OG698_08855 [Streptomyces sp. NBC_01003]